MTTNTHPLQAYQGELLQQTINYISAIAQPEKIFLLSALDGVTNAVSIFLDSQEQLPGHIYYYVLVLKKEGDATNNEVIQDKLENRKRHSTTLTAIVMGIEQFKEWLRNNHPFAIKTIESALLCFDAGNVILENPAPYDPEELKVTLKKYYQFYDKLATEFLVGADLYRKRCNYNLSLFNIHQAAEQLFLAIVRVMTGYRVNSHNMDKLHRYCRYFNAELAQLFPRHNEQEKQLFTILQGAYIDTRYKREYTAKETETNILYERIERLQAIASFLLSPKLDITR